jgi:3'(2'), 5'-bisphosphate nucleotidase
MEQKILNDLLGPVHAVAMEAAYAIAEIVNSGQAEVTTKADGSPLTAADLASHRVISEGLTGLEKPWPIVSEEGDLDRVVAEAPPIYWLVDPIDGTKEFIAGIPEYTVNIALVERGVPVLGVVVVPASGETYLAARGCGARCIRGGEQSMLTPSQAARPRSAVTSRSHPSAATQEYLGKLGVEEIIGKGSSLKFCVVADGSADFYPRLSPLNYWDSGAGAAVAIEAGCELIDTRGEGLSYDLARGLKHSGFILKPRGMQIELP